MPIIKITNSDGLNFVARDEFNNELNLDASANHQGFSPMQLLLAAVGSCSAVDVRIILEKQKQQIELLEVEVISDRISQGDYGLYKDILIKFYITGTVDLDKANKAAKLSLEKYCSVAKTLEPTANIQFQIILQ